MTTYLFSLGLVPVQAWVEEARRSRDLRAGSVILWWTMARVLHTLENLEGSRIGGYDFCRCNYLKGRHLELLLSERT